MSDKKKTKNKKKSKDKKKSKKPKKSQQQLDEERKQREAERARRDAERAKKRLTLRAKIASRKEEKKVPQTPKTTASVEKEQRKKILRYRRAQSRFALPKINQDDDLDAIARANAELQAAIQQTEDQESSESKDNTTIEITNEDDNDNEENDDEKKEEMDTVSVKSFQSVEELALSPDQETALNKLQDELEAADPDYYGFVDYKRFIQILKSNDIKLTAKQETFLMPALTLIDEGVDYYDFARKVREIGITLQPDNTLQDICEEISETVEKDKKAKEKEENELPTTDLDKMSSKDIVDVDEEQFQAFFEKAKQYRGRGMSLARMKSASADVNKSTKLGELIDDLALDGAEVDFALLKTALQTIDCNPPDKDLKYLINHVCQDDSGFVDFNYLVTFIQETSGVPATKWTKVERIITKVVKQLRMVERAELRKTQQETKLKERLQKKRNTRLNMQKEKGNDEMEQLVKEEKRLKRLKLRDLAKTVGK